MPNTLHLMWLCLCCIVMTSTPTDLSADDIPSDSEMEMCGNPQIFCPGFVWIKPSESSHPNRTGYATAEPGGPGCATPIVTYTDDIFIINACHKVYTRIWTATDPNNPSLIDTCHQTIKQIDEEDPFIENVPADQVIYTDNMDPNTTNCATKVSWVAPTIYDNHLVHSVEYVVERNGIEVDLISGDRFPDGFYTVTYTVYDFCGNFSVASFTINVMCADCHLSCPDDVCLPLGSDVSPASIGTATAFSGNMNCGAVTTIYEDKLAETGCNGYTKTIRSWFGSFANMPNTTSTCTQTIELKDMTALVLHNCPADVNVKDNFTPAYWTEPVAVSSDNSNVITLTSNHAPGGLFPVGITTVIYTATDECGNVASCSFKVSVLDDATYAGCPDDIEVVCGPDGTATVTWPEPTYSGSCSTCKRGAPKTGFMYMGSFGGSNYYCSTSYHTFENAKRLATIHGGYLATINSEAENDYLAQNIISPTAMIGYNDIANEGHFVWQDGPSSSYTKWFQHQPNDYNNQDVVELMKSSGLWNDVENDTKLEFILEVPCKNVIQTGGPRPGEKLTPGTYTISYEISDGCGLTQYCKFDVHVSTGLSIVCQDDIYVEVPTSTTEVSVSWDIPNAYTCCSSCPDPSSCITMTQTDGPASGSNFYRQSRTMITYKATDACGNETECSFYILVDIDEGSGRMTSDDGTGMTLSGEVTADGSEGTSQSENIESDVSDEEDLSDISMAKIHVTQNLHNRSESFLYPNPTPDILNIEIAEKMELGNMMIIGSDGQLITRINGTGIPNRTQMDVRHLQKGVYFIRMIYKNGGQETLRFLKV